MATLYAFNRAGQPEKPTSRFFPKCAFGCSPTRACTEGHLGWRAPWGSAELLASFRTKPVQAVSHWSVGASEAQRLAGHQGAGTAVEKLCYTWQTCLVNVNCLSWQITTRDGQHRGLYNTPLANTPHTLLCATYKESDPLAFYFFFLADQVHLQA